jgi:hypothetical protein
MSVDLSRVTEDPSKHYTRVIFEQGRPHVDADLNELQENSEFQQDTEARDVIGRSGAPKDGGGFQLSLLSGGPSPDLAITPGRMYADGILAELTPTWVTATVVAANQVSVSNTLVDGIKWATQPTQWIEVQPTNKVFQVSAVDNTGLVLTLAGAALTLNQQVRLRRQATLRLQPDLPSGAAPGGKGRYRAFLDVWEQEITWIQDPIIRETMLGGVDSAGRARVRAQVRLEPASGSYGQGAFDPQACATEFPQGWMPQSSSFSGRLLARIDPGSANTGDCVLPPTPGFQGLEPALYRCQVHTGGDTSVDHPTFKWQRDNASIATAIEAVSSDTATVHDTGRDDVLGFNNNDQVEVSDDTSDLANTPYALQTIATVMPATREIKLNAAYPAVDLARHPKIQRWDGTGNIDPSAHWQPIEWGLQVEFTAGTYRPGDYWLIPARTATGSDAGFIAWSTDDAGNALPAEPQGIEHHYAPLGLVDFDGQNFVGVEDCRALFPPLTDITASDVKFDDSTCKLQGVTNVQQAIDAICQRDGGICTFTAVPGANWESIFTQVTGDALVCLPVGPYPLAGPVVVADKGNLVIEGAGFGTQIQSQGEAALIFERCKSVQVRDLFASTAQVGTGKTQPAGGLHGALTFTDCPDVIVERVSAQTAAASYRGAACLALMFTKATSPTSGRVRDCSLRPGHQQVGVLVVDADRVAIEDCDIRAGATLPATESLYKDIAFQNAVRASMLQGGFIGKVAQAAQAAPAAPSTPALEQAAVVAPVTTATMQRGLTHGITTNVVVGNTGITFKAPGTLAAAWPEMLAAQNPQVTSPNQLLKFAKSTATNLMLNPELRDQFPAFKQWLQGILGELEASASQGIVVGGTRATVVRILDNSVTDAMQGVHVGMSARGPKAAPKVSAGPTLVAGNTIDVLLTPDATRSRHGIFVGNTSSLVVENNHIGLRRTKSSTAPVDGVRVWGIVGKLMVMRQNHVAGFTVGARITPLVPVPAPHRWIAADNVLEGGLLAPNSVVSTAPASGTPLNVT